MTCRFVSQRHYGGSESDQYGSLEHTGTIAMASGVLRAPSRDTKPGPWPLNFETAGNVIKP